MEGHKRLSRLFSGSLPAIFFLLPDCAEKSLFLISKTSKINSIFSMSKMLTFCS